MRKNKIILSIVGIILAIALIFLAINYFLPEGSKLFAITGSNTLSLTQASLQSSNSYLNGKAWILTFSAGGLGQSYYGTITPSQVDSLTSDSTRTTKNLNLQVTYADQSCQYPITGTSTFKPIYHLSYKTYTYVPLLASCDLSTGASKSGISSSNIILVAKPSGSFSCYVVYKDTQSPVGTMGNGNVHAPYTIRLDVEGNIATKTIDPLTGSTQGAIGDYAYASWAGNLVSGVSCPATYDYRASYVNGNWRIINKQAYDSYVNRYNIDPSITFAGGSSQVTNWVNDVNNFGNQALISTSFGTIDSASSLTNAVAKVPLSSPLQFPVTTLYIKAETLGIYTPVPDVRIDSSSSNCFSTGENGVISVSIKNYGDQSGTYRVYANCQNPFSQTQSASGSLSPQESKVVNLPISATATQKTESTCTVSVETTAGTKTASANVCVNPQVTCTIPYPNTFCGSSGGNDVIYQCSSNGATRNIIQTCASNEYCDTGKCVVGSSEGKGFWSSIKDFFSNLFSGLKFVGNLINVIKWILLLVGSVVALLFSKDFLSNLFNMRNKTNKIVVWIISILIGIGIAVLLYIVLLTWVFWLILIISIAVFSILKFFPAFRIFRR